MDFELDEEQRLLKRTADEFCRKQVEPFLEGFPDGPVPKEGMIQLLKMLKPLGLVGARVPMDAGGDELSNINLGLLFESFPPDVTLGCTNDIIGFRIYHGGSEEIKRKYIPPLMSVDLLAGSCISEPNAGSDLTSLETTATLVDNKYYRVNGTKIWSSGGSIADVVLAAVSLGKDDRGRTILGRLLIDRRESPFGGRDIEMIGLRKHHLSEVVFEDCLVPKENLVGEPGDGVKIFTLSWLSQRPLLGLMGVFLGQRALEASVEYAKTRREFGKPIGAFQLVQSMLVDMDTLVETSRLLCYKALSLLDKGVFARRESSRAKYFATEAAVKVTTLGIEVHGSYGLSHEYKLEQLFRDARMLTMPDGTTEIQKLQVGRELLGINAIR